MSSSQVEYEYEEKVQLGQSIQRYYTDKISELNLSGFDRIKAYLNETSLGQSRFISRDIIFAHKDFEPFTSFLARGESFTIISGLNPSSPLHLGHKVLFDMLLYLQKLGADIYIPITNDESYLDGKTSSLAESRRIAYEEIIPNIIAFGFNPKKTHIFVMSDYPDVYNLAIHISKHVTNNLTTQVFGEKALDNSGKAFYRSAVQLAQILLPQLPEFGGPRPTLIPVGIDQHPYVLLARDAAKKAGFMPPAELIFKFQNSLPNPLEKLSGSQPKTAIYLNDSDEVIRRKIQGAFTGAVSSLESHREVGGVPEACSVFSLLNFHHSDDRFVADLYKQYTTGEITTQELKKITAEFIVAAITEHREKTAQVSNVSDFLLDKPLNSFLSI